MSPTFEELSIFREPEELCILVEPKNLGIPDEAFFNETAGGLHQKLQEAWVLARLGIVISHTISPVLVSIVDGPLLDGIFKFEDSQEWEFEVVTIFQPGRRMGEDYRRGNRPELSISEFSGTPSDPTWLREPILNKIRLAQERNVCRHLVAYLNYGGGAPNLNQVAEAVSEAKHSFKTTWLINGLTFVLLFSNGEIGNTRYEWQSFLDWLPDNCKP
jgi:hypothetical protein